MPSFDVVSEVNQHELDNAVDQTNREIGTRFDFKGSNAKVEKQEGKLLLEAESEFQINQMLDILRGRISKRGIEISCLEYGQPELRGNRTYLSIQVREGIDKELAKKLTKLIKDSKLKVQASIQGEQVRVTGKKKDDLQDAIAMLRASKIEQPLQFTNFRD